MKKIGKMFLIIFLIHSACIFSMEQTGELFLRLLKNEHYTEVELWLAKEEKFVPSEAELGSWLEALQNASSGQFSYILMALKARMDSGNQTTHIPFKRKGNIVLSNQAAGTCFHINDLEEYVSQKDSL